MGFERFSKRRAVVREVQTDSAQLKLNMGSVNTNPDGGYNHHNGILCPSTEVSLLLEFLFAAETRILGRDY